MLQELLFNSELILYLRTEEIDITIKMKKILFLLILVTTFGFGQQNNLNDYKYVIVPKRFEDFKRPNMYKTSTLVKHLFKNAGFNVFYEDELPKELLVNSCLGLKVKLLNNSGMFTTKTELSLKDCKGQEVFRTAEGRSKSKDYATAFNAAIREAFKTIERLNYKYEPKNDIVADIIDDKKDVIEVSYKNDIKEVSKAAAISRGLMELNAQTVGNGYQLIDKTPQVVCKIKKTSSPNIFIADVKGSPGLLFFKKGIWFLEYYAEGVLKSEQYAIKF